METTEANSVFFTLLKKYGKETLLKAKKSLSATPRLELRERNVGQFRV